MVIAQFIVAIVGSTAGKLEKHDNAATSSMIAFICIFISIFATTWGPSAWVVVGEIFPLPIRSRGVGFSTASNWFWNCVSRPLLSPYENTNSVQIIGVITPYLVGTAKGEANMGSNIFYMWGSLCVSTLLSSLFWFMQLPILQILRQSLS